MVGKKDENQTEGSQGAEKSQGGQQKPEQQVRNRVNNQGNNQNQRGHSPFRQQGGAQADKVQSPNRRDGQNPNQSHTNQGGQANPGNSQVSQPRNNTQGVRNQPDRHDEQTRENGQNRGYYRDRNKTRDNERDCVPRQHVGSTPSGGRYGNSLRNRAEETIDDIKEDISRIEKEIELEIKEIKSLKL